MCKSDEAMKKHMEELYPEQLEHEGRNLNAEGELSNREKYYELCKRDGLTPKIWTTTTNVALIVKHS